MATYIHINTLLQRYQLNDILDKNKIIIIDIRSPTEYQYEHIEGAINMTPNDLAALSTIDYHDKIALFHSNTGNRTILNEKLIDQTSFKEKYCLASGLSGWKAANLPTVRPTSAPIDMNRQIQIIAGSLVILGIGLSHLFSPYFIIVSLIPGLGLLISGLTGFCGMAILLQKMPWNRRKT